MKRFVWPQYLVKAQYIERYFKGRWTISSGSFISGRTIPTLCILVLKVSLSFVPTVRHECLRKESLGQDSPPLNKVIPRIAESVSPQPSGRRCCINMPPLLSEKPRMEMRGHFFQAKFDWDSVKIKELSLFPL